MNNIAVCIQKFCFLYIYLHSLWYNETIYIDNVYRNVETAVEKVEKFYFNLIPIKENLT